MPGHTTSFYEKGELNSAQEELHVEPQFSAHDRSLALRSSSDRWHFLYFFPLPHQQGSFLPGLTAGAVVSPLPKEPLILSSRPIVLPWYGSLMKWRGLSLECCCIHPCAGPYYYEERMDKRKKLDCSGGHSERLPPLQHPLPLASAHSLAA